MDLRAPATYHEDVIAYEKFIAGEYKKARDAENTSLVSAFGQRIKEFRQDSRHYPEWRLGDTKEADHSQASSSGKITEGQHSSPHVDLTTLYRKDDYSPDAIKALTDYFVSDEKKKLYITINQYTKIREELQTRKGEGILEEHEVKNAQQKLREVSKATDYYEKNIKGKISKGGSSANW